MRKSTLAYASNNKLYFAPDKRGGAARDATNAKIEIIFILREKQKHQHSRAVITAPLSGRRVNRAAGIGKR